MTGKAQRAKMSTAVERFPAWTEVLPRVKSLPLLQFSFALKEHVRTKEGLFINYDICRMVYLEIFLLLCFVETN